MDKKNEKRIPAPVRSGGMPPRSVGMGPMAGPAAVPGREMKPMEPTTAPTGALDGMMAIRQVIGREQIQEARNTLQKYKQGKANLEQKIIESEQWYKLRHWECMRKEKTNQVEPVSGWLFNSIANKHADAMDNFPAPNILPREEGDKAEAEMLSSIIPVILQQNDFEQLYEALEGCPVTIRFLDPPLHEFVPTEEADIEKLAG